MMKPTVNVTYHPAPERFTCGQWDRGRKVGCGREHERGAPALLADALFGPLCVDCWPKARPVLEGIVAGEPRITLGRTCSAKAIARHYRLAKQEQTAERWATKPTATDILFQRLATQRRQAQQKGGVR